MSCRVFSRRIEDFIIDYLKVKTKENKCNNICFKLELTKKNIYLQKFLKETGLKINKQGQYSFNILNYKTKKKIISN
jgi:predicted enzyme involved in methoxymalonyl-ACP biosynthesis